MPTPLGNLTDEEVRNGWDRASLEAYQRERDAALGLVGNNVVTPFRRAAPPIRHEPAMSFNPHRW